MKKLLVLLLAASLTAACGTAVVSAEEEKGNSTTVVVGLEGNAGTLAPYSFLLGYGNVNITYQLYETMCFVCADGTVIPTMLEEIEQIDDLTYHLKIYDYIYDSAGNHITAEDIVFSVNTSIYVGNNFGAFPDFESASVIDEYTVEWKNATPFGANMMYKEFSNLVVVSKAAYEASPDGMASYPVSTSPYVVTEYTPGSSIVLEKRDDYWQTDESLRAPTGIANVDRIEFKIILDSSQMSIALETGNIDFAGSLSIDDLTYFTDESQYSIFELPGVDPYVCMLNAAEMSQCNDINLRKAILTAIDNNAIAAASSVKARPLTSLSADVLVNYVPEWDNRTEWTADPELAKEYLAESSYDGSALTLLCMGDAVNETCALVIQSELDAIGIKVNLETVDMGSFFAKCGDPAAFDILVSQNGGGAYVEQCWNNILDHSSYKTPIDDPVLQEKMNAAAATATAEVLNDLQVYIDEMAYGKGLVIPTYATAGNKTISDIYIGPSAKFIIGASAFAE